MICVTHNLSRKVCAIRTLSTILLDVIILQSIYVLFAKIPIQGANMSRNFTYEDVHVDGAERIAEAAAKYDVDRLIHVSSYNASEDSPSEFFKTKGWGERVVREIFPETTIVRPAPMFGFEDHLLHKLAGVTNLFTSNHMQEKYWPVHVSYK